MRDHSLFLDTLLCQIRGVIISYSKIKANNLRKDKKNLEKKITDLEMKIDKGEDSEENKNKLEQLNKSLVQHRENYLKGHHIRSRANLIKDWKKPSKYFLNPEEKNYL